MCGIVGAAATRDIVPVLIEGLKRLEYRGYDSCGVATLSNDRLERLRSVARVAELSSQIDRKHLVAETGIAHTRWATHGAPVTHNAHPIFSRDEIALVHNGIIENHDELRHELKTKVAARRPCPATRCSAARTSSSPRTSPAWRRCWTPSARGWQCTSACCRSASATVTALPCAPSPRCSPLTPQRPDTQPGYEQEQM